MFIDCIQLFILPQPKGNQKYSLRKVVINSDHVTDAKEDIVMEGVLNTDPQLFPEGMLKEQKFTIIFFANKTMTIVGELGEITKKVLNRGNRTLLKG